MTRHAATKYVGPEFDIVGFPNFMYAGFKSPPDLIPSPVTWPSITFGPGFRCTSIGVRKPGFQSAGSATIEMIRPAFLQYAGLFLTFDNKPVFMFESWLDRERPAMPDGLPNEGYSKVYVALYGLDFATLMFVTHSQASRIVSKDMEPLTTIWK